MLGGSIFTAARGTCDILPTQIAQALQNISKHHYFDECDLRFYDKASPKGIFASFQFSSLDFVTG